MPFTPAHAAAAWPLQRLLPQLPLSALVIGTMSPDFEYWFRLAPGGRHAHSLAGILVFCLPVSLIVWIVFRRLIRPALLGLLPTATAAAVAPARTSVLLAVAAVLIGAFSHVAWDGFTHNNDWGVELFPVLRAEVTPPFKSGLRWYKLLQHASTIGGLAAVTWWVWRWLRSQPPAAHRFTPEQRRETARVVAMIAFAGLLGAILNWARILPHGFVNALGLLAVGGMVGLSVALLVLGLQHRFRWRA